MYLVAFTALCSFAIPNEEFATAFRLLKFLFILLSSWLGYQRALYENGILYNPSVVCTGDWTRISGYHCTDRLLGQGVTAIFCMNDLMAGGVYDRLEELKLVPGEDISVAGYDNRELSGYYKPPLSTIMLPLHDIGYEASEVMLKMLEDSRNISPIHRVSCYPLIRRSVKNIGRQV